MLTSMRRGASGWIAKILFALLILSFGAWGIVDYLQPDPDPVVITVGDTEIRSSTYRNQFSRSLDRLRQQIGSTVTQEFAVQMGLDNEVSDALINQQVLTREAERMGMVVNDDVLRAAIASDPTFQGPAGEFSRTRYEEVLFRSGMSEQRFLGDLAGRLVRDPLIAAATVAPPPPEGLVKAQNAFAGETRTAVILYRDHSTFPAPADPGETVLREAYQAEDNLYQQGELRDLSALILDPEQIAKGFAISDARVAEEYESRKGQYSRAETRNVAQLLFQDADAAARALARLQAGEDWVSVVDGSGGVAAELGVLTKGQFLTPELADAAFAPSAPGAVGPVQSDFGYHVLLVKEISPESTTPLAEVRDEIAHSIALDMAVDELISRANAVEDSIAAGSSLEGAADAAGVPLSQFRGVSRTGQNAAGDRVEGLPPEGQFLSVAFQTEENESSILTERPNGGYFIVRVDRVVPETKKPFDQVRAQVLADWQEAQRAEEAEQAANAVADRLSAGADPGAVAEESGFSMATPAAFTRAQTPDPVTPDLGAAVFAASKGETLVHNDYGRVFVATVTDVTAGQAAESAELDQLRQRIDRDRRLEIAQAFQRAIRARYDVEIDQAAVNNLLR
jgi:peptidyl-prolyl cis-trans isomerase D